MIYLLIVLALPAILYTYLCYTQIRFRDKMLNRIKTLEGVLREHSTTEFEKMFDAINHDFYMEHSDKADDDTKKTLSFCYDIAKKGFVQGAYWREALMFEEASMCLEKLHKNSTIKE